MRTLLLLAASLLLAQPPIEFSCPMDPEVRAKGPGKCPRCGMALVAGIPEPLEYPVALRVTPPAIPNARPLRLEFQVSDPKTRKPVADFQIVHEKLFHLFVISQDLEYFAHLHPQWDGRSRFHLETTLPQPGVYRLLADFYPTGGAPQFVPKTIITAGYRKSLQESLPRLAPDLAPKRGENLTVQLSLEPPQPLAGKKTLMFFHLDPADGLEKYIGAWAHMLAASSDLIDTIHEHPFLADGGPQMQFNVFFPREGVYRVWVQFQRKGVVNTVAFNVPVSTLK